MDNKFLEAKKKYEEIKIPKELNSILKDTIQKYDDTSDENKNEEIEFSKYSIKKKFQYKNIISAAAALAVVFVGIVNSSSTIAYAMYQVPIVGELAKMVTFREYHYESDNLQIDASIPKIENTGNTELETKINDEIQKRIDEVIAAGEKAAKEYNKILLEKGAKEEELYKGIVTAEYEVKFSNEAMLSFVVHTDQLDPGMAHSDVGSIYYNIDLKTGKELKISDVLGKEYKKIANKSISEQIKERMASDENQIFFGVNEEDKELGVEGFTGIDENRTFYINEKGNVVVTFDKYEIAPGYMGMPEFEIIK